MILACKSQLFYVASQSIAWRWDNLETSTSWTVVDALSFAVVMCADGYLRAISLTANPSQGVVIWATQIGAAWATLNTISNSFVLLYGWQSNPILVDATNGAVLWHASFGDVTNYLGCLDGLLFFASSDFAMVSLNLSTGSVLDDRVSLTESWTLNASETLLPQPTISLAQSLSSSESLPEVLHNERGFLSSIAVVSAIAVGGLLVLAMFVCVLVRCLRQRHSGEAENEVIHEASPSEKEKLLQ